MKTIDAIKDKLIVRVFSKEEKRESGVVIPGDFNQEPHSFGEVISVGDEVHSISRGDVIVFHTRAGQEVILDDENYKCLTFNEVYGRLRETKS